MPSLVEGGDDNNEIRSPKKTRTTPGDVAWMMRQAAVFTNSWGGCVPIS